MKPKKAVSTHSSIHTLPPSSPSLPEPLNHLTTLPTRLPPADYVWRGGGWGTGDIGSGRRGDGRGKDGVGCSGKLGIGWLDILVNGPPAGPGDGRGLTGGGSEF